MSRSVKNFIQGIHMKKGALHKSLGIAQDKKIPEYKLEQAEHSRNPKLRARANLAETLKNLPRHHGSR